MRRFFVWLVSFLACLHHVSAAAPSDPPPGILGSTDPSVAAPIGSAIAYQGRLLRNGTPVDGMCNLVFKLYDAATGGVQIGPTVNLSSQVLTEGLFVGSLDFGAGAFSGQARWLEIQVQGPGDPGFTLLDPRQAVNPAPYALYSLNTTGSPWVTGGDGADLTYPGGGIGITGASSPFASGKGVFIERIGGAGYIFGFDYDTVQPIDLLVNSPGGNVGVGAVSSFGRLHALTSAPGVSAMYGKHTGDWAGVWGESFNSSGTVGVSTNWVGVYGESSVQAGVWGRSNNAIGVYGESYAAGGFGGYFRNNAGGEALHVDGRAVVKTLQILGGADLAERFEAAEKADPGTVMAIDPTAPGRMRIADEAYCRRVAGVVSGAESLSAGVELGVEKAGENALPIALTGRVWVKCEARSHPIRPGDLLTTSDLPGHAMTAADPTRSAGAVLGKAMTSLEAGTGMVLVLVSLQ